MKELLLNIILIPIFCVDMILLILTFGAYCDDSSKILTARTHRWLKNIRYEKKRRITLFRCNGKRWMVFRRSNSFLIKY